MKDIAEALGVSVVTVSKPMRGHSDIAKGTSERILQHAREHNYRPNLMARSLVTGRSSLVGLIVPDLIHPFFSEIAKALSKTLRQRNFCLVVASSESEPQLEEAEINQMLAHRLDALVLASFQNSPESLRAISTGAPPLILLDRSFPRFLSNFIGADDFKIGQLATEHLLAIGRTRVAHIRGPENSVGLRRLEGYHAALAKCGHSAQNQMVISTPHFADDRISGERAMQELLRRRPRPDAVFCFNDAIAVAAMACTFSAGVRIPQDMAIVGCGNYYYSDTLRIPLSSVDQRTTEIGVRTAKMIFELLDAEEPGRARKILLKPRLIPRASSQQNESTTE